MGNNKDKIEREIYSYACLYYKSERAVGGDTCVNLSIQDIETVENRVYVTSSKPVRTIQ